MSDHVRRELSTLLREVNEQRPGAFSELVDAVYADLHGIAQGKMRDQFKRPLEGLTVPATAIVSDAVMRLRQQRAAWKNTEQFFAIATRLLRQLILDYQEKRLAKGRGAGRRGTPIDSRFDSPKQDTGLGNLVVSDLLNRLHEEHPRVAEVVTLRILCNHALPEIARRMQLAQTTVERDWRFAKAWLGSRLKEGKSDVQG